jgi:ABC-2 type transport system permease protein
VSAPPTPAPGAAIGRIAALILRHVYLLRSSWPRLFELMYWPTIQMARRAAC